MPTEQITAENMSDVRTNRILVGRDSRVDPDSILPVLRREMQFGGYLGKQPSRQTGDQMDVLRLRRIWGQERD